MKNIVLMGPQGSGKGTQAEIIARNYGIPHISTGDIFRENIEKSTELGKKVKDIMDRGELVSDDITNEIVRERLAKDDCKNGFVFDGYPRTFGQAKALSEFSEIKLVIEINIDDEAGIKRLSSRKQCKNCDAIYGLDIPPKKEGVCDKCGGELYQRDDDKPEAIKERLKEYHEKTGPIIDFYKEKGLLKTIDGLKGVEEVQKEIKEEIDKLN